VKPASGLSDGYGELRAPGTSISGKYQFYRSCLKGAKERPYGPGEKKLGGDTAWRLNMWGG